MPEYIEIRHDASHQNNAYIFLSSHILKPRFSQDIFDDLYTATSPIFDDTPPSFLDAPFHISFSRAALAIGEALSWALEDFLSPKHARARDTLLTTAVDR